MRGGRKGGVLEWVCKLEIDGWVRDVCGVYLSLVVKRKGKG